MYALQASRMRLAVGGVQLSVGGIQKAVRAAGEQDAAGVGIGATLLEQCLMMAQEAGRLVGIMRTCQRIG